MLYPKLSRDYTNRCGNCHGYLEPEMKYCPDCGTKRGEGKFAPYSNDFCCIYGPPVTVQIRCRACGKERTDHVLGRDSSKFCPFCGSDQLDKTEHDAY